MQLSTKDIQKIVNVGLSVRKWARGKDDCEDPNELCGMCAICSYRLCLRLQRLGFEVELCSNNNHAFVRVKRPRTRPILVDVTATQFDEEQEVVISKKTNRWYWAIDNRIKFPATKRQLRQAFGLWPKEQVPFLR